jgi:hypothetical protein
MHAAQNTSTSSGGAYAPTQRSAAAAGLPITVSASTRRQTALIRKAHILVKAGCRRIMVKNPRKQSA